MDISQDLNNSAELELENQQEQILLHMDELTAKIDKVLTHQHELIALVRKASKHNICLSIAKEEELGPVKHDIASNAAAHVLSEAVSNPLTKLNEAKRDQRNTEISKESQCRQNSDYKKVLPETPFQSVLDFKVFEELIKNSEEAYHNLITELTAQNIYIAVNFLKTSWRRIMSDHVAQHFCWTGTQEKPAIRTLSVTKALKVAYQRKFNFCTNDDFQRTIQPFFQHAKTRLQKKQNYEKVKRPT